MEPKVKVTGKILEFLNDFVSSSSDCHDIQEIQTFLNSSEQQYIPFRLIKNAYSFNKKSGRKGVYLNEILRSSDLCLPEYHPPPKSPELQARLEKLRNEQANKAYKEMVKNVDKREFVKPDSIGKEIKVMNNHMIAVFNFIITVGGAFAFAYKATEYAVGGGSNAFALQLLNGLVFGTLVFFADLYFLVKQTS